MPESSAYTPSREVRKLYAQAAGLPWSYKMGIPLNPILGKAVREGKLTPESLCLPDTEKSRAFLSVLKTEMENAR